MYVSFSQNNKGIDKMKRMIFCFYLLTVVSFCTSQILSDVDAVSGISVMELKSPVTPALKSQQQKIAKDSLKSSITIWVNEFFDNCLDPDNSVSRYFLEKFVDRCIQKAKITSSIDKRDFTVEISVPNHTLDLVITTYNAHYDAQALQNWNSFTMAQQQNNPIAVFNAGMRALFYSKAHIGSPLEAPGVPEGMSMNQVLQSALQEKKKQKRR